MDFFFNFISYQHELYLLCWYKCLKLDGLPVNLLGFYTLLLSCTIPYMALGAKMRSQNKRFA
jgi:hypothetical protein